MAGGTGILPVRKYTWGLDLGGLGGTAVSAVGPAGYGAQALQGAGGVGGLLALEDVADPNDPNDNLGIPGTPHEIVAQHGPLGCGTADGPRRRGPKLRLPTAKD